MTPKSIHVREVGDFVKAWCNKCGEGTNHTVIMKQDGLIRKVQCWDCKGRHNYKPLPASMSPSSDGPTVIQRLRKTRALSRDVSGPPPKSLWEKKILKATKEERPYTPEENYEVGDLVLHHKFGTGIVEKVIGFRKLVVLFKEGQKQLICNYSRKR